MSNEMTNDQFNPEKLSLVELAQRDDFEAYLLENHPREAAVLAQKGMDRRSFLKIMGASLALSGLGLTGCAARPSGEPIIPYTRMPEEITAGIPLYFASTFVLGGYATGLLLETHEARPARIEGNPNHPASLGSSSAIVQASILDLYNPERSTLVRNDNEITDYEAFLAALADEEIIGGNGEGLRILTETVTSPTLASQLNALLEAYPEAVWYQYEPLARDNAVAGSRLAFDDDINTFYSLENAQVILGLGGDFLSDLPGSIRYARDFASGRQVREGITAMNRLYAVEATPGLAGAAADHRLSLRASEIEGFARALAAALGVAGVEAPAEGSWDAAWLDQLVADLQAAGSQSVIIPGDELSPAVHALVHAMNAELGNVGETVNYTPSVVANPTVQIEDLAALVDEMNDGDVDALFILGGNPVYTAPADLEFAEALAEVRFSVHLSLYNDETSQLVTWHLPQTHFIEEWSDALAYDGTASLVQPPIGPLYDTVRSAHDVLALLLEDERSNYEIVRQYWEEQYFGADFEDYWRVSLHNGVLADTALPPFNPGLRSDLANTLPDAPAPIAGLEVVFRADPAIWDGRFANIAWLQELPDPLTKVTWDNAALISEATARELRVETNRLVELTLADRTMRVPVYITTGQPDNTITLSLGYGRGLSADLTADENFNAGVLRTSDAMYVSGSAEVSRVRRVPNTYRLAASRLPTEVEGLEPVRSATLATFIEDPEFAQEEADKASLLNQPFEYDGNAWGMTIDLTACIGCNACMIACQMENNIPTVGREGVERARDMSWIRVDRHYGETETGELDTKFQPVPCMHCEEAPCEIVCPVSATVHNHEGLNQMVYNRCIGTRYCSANCPYGVRRFNFFDYVADDAILLEVRNPNVSVRAEGVMEKCTYCVQRINRANSTAKIEERPVMDGEVVPACAAACPTKAIVFGNINDAEAQVTMNKEQPHNYALLGHLNVKPRTTYLARVTNPNVVVEDTSESSEEA